MPKINSLLYFLLLMVVLIGCTNNDEAPVDNEELNEETEESTDDATYNYDGDGGFLWKVDNGETTAYILGSIHLGHEDYYPLANKIEEAYESSDVILPEINMFEVDMTEEELNEMALFDDGTTLDKVLSEESFRKLSNIFEAQGMSVENFKQYQPWFVESLLTEFIAEKSDLSSEYGVDLYFLQRALEEDKKIMELETIEGQYEMLTGFSMDTQVETLENYIGAYEDQADWLNQLGYNWVHGNSKRDSLVNQLSDSFEGVNEEYKQELNDSRNIRMANKLEEILQSDRGQTYFAIIGSVHALIDPSVPSELEQKGYEVERIY
ncbi:TraB/GumN family protein [Oceanobacillus jordanicus]|uniref:TraB/GumN family protein n=1 Tax=Oceanobacillus jordanicus TaxID=2867266 RepID=A0AAW5B849_9BACI|nr:TraB/GumN family protein [Oceanobacillus jordanicus]MCG3419417.1 TraB/GumN family protein [Oceanobacillus jordanicus]